ncbi:hypothetical protein D3C86_1248620 [compost metagenome]
MHLAVFLGDFAGDVIGILIEQRLEFEHDAGALHRRGIAPAYLRLDRIGHGRIELGQRRERQFRALLAGSRVEHDFSPPPSAL